MGVIFLSLSLMTILFLVVDNRRRARRSPPVPLRPNCLISRYPLLFLGGKKSLFYFMNYWGDLPHFLTEHGYEVFHLNLPAKNGGENLKKFLHEQSFGPQKFHLVIDESNQEMMEALFAQNDYPCVKSCLNISTLKSTSRSTRVTRESLRPLKQAIEQLTLDLPERSLLWRMHELKTQQSNLLDLRRYLQLHAGTRPYFDKILDQVILISERDFVQDTTPGEPHHESSKRRPRDLSRFEELS